MPVEWMNALVGGIIIGIAVSLMLILNGRVTGISGIVYALLKPTRGDIAWRNWFVIGLILGGLTLRFLNPSVFEGGLATENWTVVVAGLLVGFGTVLGSGCTSGHGVCGISRMSPRSLLATLLFVGAGVASVAIFRLIGVLS